MWEREGEREIEILWVTGRVALQMKPFLKATLDWRVSKLIFIVETAKKTKMVETAREEEGERKRARYGPNTSEQRVRKQRYSSALRIVLFLT